MQYLNTDLDIVSDQDLSPLAAALERGGLLTLHVDRREDGLWYATFETDESYGEPEPNFLKFLEAIASLDDGIAPAWRACQIRELNIGYECGTEPWAFNQAISAKTLARVAAAGIALRITIYPASGPTPHAG
jgi:hypothetical protein